MKRFSVMNNGRPGIPASLFALGTKGDGLAPMDRVPLARHIVTIECAEIGTRGVVTAEHACTALRTHPFTVSEFNKERNESRPRPNEHGGADEHRAANTRQGLHACLL